MRILDNLEPKKVFSFFEDIASIPHGSGNTKAISNYLVSFAKSKNYEFYQDDMNNVIIIKEASAGYENSGAIILQSHMDMVCEKDADCPRDMSSEPVELMIDGDFVSAKGTTLGADNGIGVAYTLALLDDDSLCHPRIEAVFTVDEEVGMLGAFGIDVSPLKAKRMLNLDGGSENVFIVSCAGGITVKSTFGIKREEYKGEALKITISGLSGGHSGGRIGDGGANSNSLFGRLFSIISDKCNFRIAHIEGGFKDNAIPVETTAVIITDNADACKDAVSYAESVFKNEYSATDPELEISVLSCESAAAFDKESNDKIMLLLNIAPNGVQTMSSQIKDLVQTSLNFAILNCADDCLEATFSVRSSVESQKSMVSDRLIMLTSYLGGTVQISGDYPGWEYKTKSDFRDLMTEVFVEQFGYGPKIEAVHAGLECGLFSGKIPGLDCITYGPDMHDIHTPRERLSVSSVQKSWKLICKLLKRMK